MVPAGNALGVLSRWNFLVRYKICHWQSYHLCGKLIKNVLIQTRWFCNKLKTHSSLRSTNTYLRKRDFLLVISAKADIQSLSMKFKEINYEKIINFFCGWVLRCPCE